MPPEEMIIYTESPSDDDWDELDEYEVLEDGIDDFIITSKDKKGKTIED